jgi:hypothetical protein
MYQFSFVLFQHEDNIDEDSNDPERHEYLIEAGLPVDLANPAFTEGLLALEDKLTAEIIAALGMPVIFYGHDAHGNLDCAIFCSSVEEVRKIDSFIRNNTVGGDCNVELCTPYTMATEWTLYTDGVNGPRYGYGAWSHNTGTVEEWLDSQP